MNEVNLRVLAVDGSGSVLRLEATGLEPGSAVTLSLSWLDGGLACSGDADERGVAVLELQQPCS